MSTTTLLNNRTNFQRFIVRIKPSKKVSYITLGIFTFLFYICIYTVTIKEYYMVSLVFMFMSTAMIFYIIYRLPDETCAHYYALPPMLLLISIYYVVGSDTVTADLSKYKKVIMEHEIGQIDLKTTQTKLLIPMITYTDESRTLFTHCQTSFAFTRFHDSRIITVHNNSLLLYKPYNGKLDQKNYVKKITQLLDCILSKQK